jgi:5-formyltetrahydrofolate cyclo-ligase
VTAQAGSITSTLQAERQQLRARMRAARRALPPAERALAERRIASHIRRLPEFRRARRVAVFLAFDGEPSLCGVIAAAAARGKRVYAPVLTGARMHFAELDTRVGLATNFFGILEPRVGGPIDPRELDLVLTPLVAFDDRGVRVGVGRGYYDRCFAFLLNRRQWRRPKLVGVAYERQRVGGLPRQAWDVPLCAVVTEAGLRRFGGTEP